jgi:ArsR family transcriptional regulator
MAETCCGPGSSPIDDAQAADLATLFKAMGDPVRVKMYAALSQEPGREICACDFVSIAGKSQPTVSHHLKVLREAGLVRGERRGTWIWYSVVPDRLAELRRAFDLEPLLAIGVPTSGS